MSLRSPLFSLTNSCNADELNLFKKAKPIAIDLLENEKEFKVHADVPGVKKEEINISLNNGLLTISVESKKENESAKADNVIISERSFIKSVRSIDFHSLINEEAISAKYENGTLELLIPKKNIPESKKIEIV